MPQFCLLFHAILQSWRLKGGAMAQWPPPKYAPEYKYQHCISSTDGSISIHTSIFLGAQFQKAPGAVGKWGPFSKRNWISYFLAKGKNLTPRQVEIPK